MTDRIAEPWGPRTPYTAGQQWPDRVDGYLADGVRWPATMLKALKALKALAPQALIP